MLKCEKCGKLMDLVEAEHHVCLRSEVVEIAKIKLADSMRAISDHGYAAGWMQNLEYDLWSAVINGPCGYGMNRIVEEDISRLKQLSKEAGGWFVFEDKADDESFIPMKEWEDRFALHNGIPVRE